MLTDDLSRKRVEVAERYADGRATEEERESAYWKRLRVPSWRATDAAEGTVDDRVLHRLPEVMLDTATAAGMADPRSEDAGTLDERAAQAHLLRDIFGNPFRPVTFAPAWLTWHGGLVVSMAQRMYDSRDFSDLPILADALEEAGCSDPDILGHCRQPGEHVRGCWVVDLVLGKS